MIVYIESQMLRSTARWHQMKRKMLDMQKHIRLKQCDGRIVRRVKLESDRWVYARARALRIGKVDLDRFLFPF